MLDARHRGASEPTLRRLPLYRNCLKSRQQQGLAVVCSAQLAAELQLDPTQVRKDLEAAGVAGRPKVGYRVDDAIAAIEEFLGWTQANEAFLVGTGSLGSALLGYRKFEEYGLKITAAFDADPLKVGATIHDKQVLPLSSLPEMARRLKVRMGIITVPADAAQAVANLMVKGGIRGIWNFAPANLRLPQRIIVHNENLYCSLAALSQKMAKALRPARSPRASAAAAR